MQKRSLHNAVVFIQCEFNRYSLAVLTGILETDERFETLELHFLRYRRKDPPEHLFNRMCELARQYSKLVVAFSFHTANVIEMAAVIAGVRRSLQRRRLENVLLIAGGSHPSGDPAGTLHLGIDVVVIGEGEATFPNLLERYFSQSTYDKIPGIAYVNAERQYIVNDRPAPVDISKFPPFALKHGRYCPMEISRGCPWGCRFCQTSYLMGRRMRHRSIDSIVHYAELSKHKGLTILRFISPNAFAYGSSDGRSVNLEALEAMLKAVSEIYGRDQVYLGSFPSEVRPEHVTPETLALVKRYCVNQNLLIGAQSGSERLLKAIHRGHGVAEILRAVELACAAGFTPNVDFIFGLPGEIAQDRAQTLELIQQIIQMGARIHSHTFMPLVGTPFARCAPGVVDQETRALLQSLRGKSLEHGSWKTQEQLAQATTEFLTHQNTMVGKLKK